MLTIPPSHVPGATPLIDELTRRGLSLSNIAQLVSVTSGIAHLNDCLRRIALGSRRR